MVIHGHGATNQGRVAKETTLELSEEEKIVQIQFSRESMFIYSRNLRSVVPDCLQGVLLVSALQSCARGEGDTLVGAGAHSFHPRHHHRPSWPHHWRRDCAGGHPAQEHQLHPHLLYHWPTGMLKCSKNSFKLTWDFLFPWFSLLLEPCNHNQLSAVKPRRGLRRFSWEEKNLIAPPWSPRRPGFPQLPRKWRPLSVKTSWRLLTLHLEQVSRQLLLLALEGTHRAKQCSSWTLIYFSLLLGIFLMRIFWLLAN